MNKLQKDFLLMDDKEIYTEAQNRIKKCKEKRGKKLDLSSLSLKEIPPEITELETLEELNLTCFDLKKIPAFIGEITYLKKLLIGSEHSDWHEHENIILPPELGNLRNLQYLFLGYDIEKIPDWVWELKNLEALIIFNDYIDTIPAAAAEMKKLRKLRIYGEKITALPERIGELSLTALDLQCPQLKALPESFSNLKTMKGFLFDRCNLTAIPNFICGWTDLEELGISMDNTFQGPYTEMKNMPKDIGNLRKLNYLKLDGANIAKIPDSLGNCPLGYLEISGSFKAIPETFGSLSELKVLRLSSSNSVTLPDSFGNLSRLSKLEIRAPALEIPASFSKLRSLEELYMNTDKDLVLPKKFGDLLSLSELSLFIDNLNAIPASISGCKNLKHVFIRSDKLSALPESFCQLKKLEELHLETFALKALPNEFGGLTSLKTADVFSGAVTSLPESIGNLKNLRALIIDAYYVEKIPESFKKLSYVKEINIKTKKEDYYKSKTNKKIKKKHDIAEFAEIANMGYQCRWKLLEKYSIKEIESILCSAPDYHFASNNDKDVFKDIMRERYCRLNRKFKWTDENKKRIAKVSDEFLNAWEDSFAKAKTMIEALYEKEQGKNPFGNERYWIELTLYPEILQDEDDDKEINQPYYKMTSYLNPGLNMIIKYDPLTKSEEDFRKNINISRDLSWNIEGFGDIDLKDYYICYALHELYSHNEWAFEDIPKINNILCEVEITWDRQKF
jgi:Leucine-rich repeat (LRR) protein